MISFVLFHPSQLIKLTFLHNRGLSPHPVYFYRSVSNLDMPAAAEVEDVSADEDKENDSSSVGVTE